MKSGMYDYDDEEMRKWAIYNPDKDFTPLDFLWHVNKDWRCTPGECESYSSVGYALLGFALA